MAPPITPIAERFWSKVHRGEASECWQWNGAGAPFYGRIHEGGLHGRLLMATHVSWMLANGAMPPVGVNVLHRCDNPPCVNPAHLFLGGQSENTKDAISKGRWTAPRGEQNGQSKLTRDQAMEIRRLRRGGAAGYEIARRFGVSQAAVSMIASGRRWPEF